MKNINSHLLQQLYADINRNMWSKIPSCKSWDSESHISLFYQILSYWSISSTCSKHLDTTLLPKNQDFYAIFFYLLSYISRKVTFKPNFTGYKRKTTACSSALVKDIIAKKEFLCVIMIFLRLLRDIYWSLQKN